MKLIKTTFLSLVLLFTIASCSTDPVAEDAAVDYSIDLSLANENDAAFAQEVLTLINEHRTNIGLDALQTGSQFSSAYAVDHTNYMIDLSQINHDNYNVRAAALQSTGAQQVGENVAYGYNTAEAVVNAWLNSPSHRDNIEGNFTHAGFGIKFCGQSNTYYFTQLFYKV